ncbi:PREDICTED: uncharacterized protein LOC106806443 [Priapulus caudatus]|uniref:Uncharacterized protein LOC106806443 n=1 Tax=Priapulus caudatus TaxID=37621 RepID=A0ABM1DV93_PRICU|nr:PREDICTED: uncharacterized protein LOC106806443 [Priapulus caudatus]
MRANERECLLSVMGKPFGQDAYTIGFAKKFFLKAEISHAILEMSESGKVDRLRERWYGSLHCFRQPHKRPPQKLSELNMAGMFVMLGFGVISGLLAFLAEWIVYKWLVPYVRHQPPSACKRHIVSLLAFLNTSVYLAATRECRVSDLVGKIQNIRTIYKAHYADNTDDHQHAFHNTVRPLESDPAVIPMRTVDGATGDGDSRHEQPSIAERNQKASALSEASSRGGGITAGVCALCSCKLRSTDRRSSANYDTVSLPGTLEGAKSAKSTDGEPSESDSDQIPALLLQQNIRISMSVKGNHDIKVAWTKP